MKNLTLQPVDVQHAYEEIHGRECSLSEAKDYLSRYLLIKNFNHTYSLYSFLKKSSGKKELELV
jgi:hypothetical protein